ncbi:hypothetical protein BGZ99_003100 [Dissophora globulifera]|uniref:DUF7905 domain-containing protein n=1 Tax=Dissophora globulifera TaxID=979702 RepID=A0A9P6RUA5_9FUNG|nr:hypothetical protein BGZ99_003100 [Dissophora globulifera]
MEQPYKGTLNQSTNWQRPASRPAAPRPVTLYLHSLHSWKTEELEGLRETINRIAKQNSSSIKYDHVNFVFAVSGDDLQLQNQALDALDNLLEKQLKARQDSSQPILPEKPLRDVKLSSASSTDKSKSVSVSGVLIDMDDFASTESISSQPIRHSIEFRVSDSVRDPFEMYYADKRQKVDLPTMIAQECDCVAEISKDGRTINVSGENSDNVDSCLQKIRQMMDYFLRTPFRMEKVVLVYGNSRDEFRLQFVPLVEHRYYAAHIGYLPTGLTKIRRENFCVAEKAVFDVQRGMWALSGGIRLPALGSEALSKLPGNTRSKNASPSPSTKGLPSTPWGRRASSSSDQQRSPSHGAGSSNLDWHEQENPSFGFGPATPTRSMSPAGWGPVRTQSTSSQPSPQPSWGSGRGQSGWDSPTPATRGSQVALRRAENPEWSGPTFEAKDPGDFPSLSMSSHSTSKKTGMPTLPPVRKVGVPESDSVGWSKSSSSSASTGKRPTSSSIATSNLEPTDFKNARATSSAANVGSSRDNNYNDDDNYSSSSSSLVFGDNDFDYLANISAHSSASSSSRPKERDNSGLERPRLQDPAKHEEDTRRTMRTLPSLQASPALASSSLPQFVDKLRSYNMRRSSEAIRNGLAELRGHRKEIRLVGRLGSVLYPSDPSVLSHVWEYTQLENVIVRERGVRPVFSPIATVNTADVNNLYGFLGPFKSESAHFEIECNTRINPTSRYDRTIVSVPSTMAILDRVVTPWETYGEVIWNAVDNHIDFEIALQAREGTIHDTKSALGRTDVKPFSTFRKRMSLGTHNTHITCHDVPNYLHILGINFKETRTYEKPGPVPFTVVIHKVEELELQRTDGLDAVTGRTFGEGKKWYEFEVYSEKVHTQLRSNLTLIPGTAAEWTVNDIVGEDPNNSDELLRMVRAMMLLVDECHTKFK